VSTTEEVAITVEPGAVDADFDAWVAPHLAVLQALARRQVGMAAAEDVVQETLLRAWRRRETFQRDRSVRAWLIGILLDQARRHRVRRPWLPFLRAEFGVGRADPDDRLEVERAVSALPHRQRQAITLHYLTDLPISEIALVLGISESSVKTHLRAGREQLRKIWEQS
jgi:RNA polymerase sigma-70 factor (ECF subfamily)